MSLIKIKAFSIDSTDSFTFGNANITSNLVAGNANVSGIVNVTGNLSAGNLFAAQIGNSSTYLYGDGSNITNISATTAKKLANGTSNVDIASSGGNVTIGVGGTGGIATFTTTGANITGYANITGNITAGNVNAGNLLTANYVAGTLTTAAQPNITSVGTLTGLTVNGDITSTGNLIVAGTTTYVNSTVTAIKDPIIELGDGANNATLTSDDGMDRGSLLHYYTGGATRDAFMGWKNSTGEFTFASNVTNSLNVVTVNTLGKIKAGDANLGNLVTSNYFTGNGSLLTSITGANVTGQVGNALIAGTVYTNAQPNITSVGTLSTLVVGNATANSTFGNGTITLTSAGNITGGNLVSATYLTGTLTTAAQPNITSVGTLTNTTLGSANSFTGGNLVSATYLGGTLTTAAQPNVTSVGTLTGLTSGGTINFTTSGNVSLGAVGNVKVTGGSSGQYLQTDGTGNLSWASISTGTLTNGTSNIQVLSSGNITLSSAGTANVAIITSTGVNVAGYVNATGNITGGNIAGGNLVSANYISGNGSLLTSITGANVTGQVGNALIAGTVYTNAQPNITSVGTLTSLSVTGNISAGNVAGGNLTTSNYFSGNGSLLTSITGANVTGQVGNALIAGTVYTNAQPNITSVGTLSSLVVSGTTNLGAIGNITITGGSAGYVLKTDGAGNLTWGSASSGTGNANISGSDTQLFFNDGGSNTLGASSSLTFNKSTNTLTTANLVVSTTANLGAAGNIKITGGSSGYLLKTDGTGNLSWYNPTYTSVTADDFTGNGVQTSFTLSTTPTDANYTIVSVGGVVQPKTTYTVSGSTLTFSSAPPSTAPVEVTTINTGMSGGGGGGGAAWTYSAISANTTATAGYRYIVDTSSANLTVTLPSSGTLGDEVMIIDGTGNASTHQITVGRNGGNIQGLASDMTVTTDRAAFTLVYYNSTQGWILTNV
jgi:hypothetical protein